MSATHRPLLCVRFAASLWFLLGVAACGSDNTIVDPGPSEIPAELVSLSLSSDTTFAGTTVQGTVSISVPAAASGAAVSLSSSNPSVAVVPANVVVPQGARSAAFPVKTVAAGGPITITGSLGTSRTASITVTAIPMELMSLTPLSPFSMAGPGTAQGTVRISVPAPSEGITIKLSTTNARVASVPDSVTVQPDSTTAPFTIEAFAVPNTSQVTIDASLGGKTLSLVVFVGGGIPALANFRVIPNPGTLATGEQQCEVQAAGGGSSNLLKCTFESLSAVRESITNYIWRFPQTGGIATFMTTSRTLSGVTLTCGSFGTGDVGSVVEMDIELEIVFASGALKTLKTIRFIRNGPCG